MWEYLWISFGGAIGTAARFWCSGIVDRHWGETFPWGTLIVNVSGCFVIGFLFAFTGTEGRTQVSPLARQFFMIGLCGGYTTFSAFSLQTFNLMRSGEWSSAVANTLLSVALCILAVWLGHAAALALNSLKGA